MSIDEYLSVIEKEIHSVVVSMVDRDGKPASAFMDVMLADESGLYFLTSDNGRDLYHNLNNSEYVSICGKTDGDYYHSKMITVKGRIRNIGKSRVDELLDRNDYLKKLYPDNEKDKRQILDVFQVYEGQGTYQEFATFPPMKAVFSFGGQSTDN
jgi:uncharacterized pyridoxamine 5'-phosphate oxidase family protein